MKITWLVLFIGAFALAADHAAVDATPDQIINHLLEGNRRYVAERSVHPHQDAGRRSELAKAQHPPAIILGCADSRVGPEVIFDQGLGDLFVVRVAGNIVDNDVLGSMEYAVDHLGSKVIVVLGHQRCGAVSAAVQGGHVQGHVASLIHAIQPAVQSSKHSPGDAVENAIRANVQRVVHLIETSQPVLAKALREGKLRVVGAEYMLDSGAVDLIK